MHPDSDAPRAEVTRPSAASVTARAEQAVADLVGLDELPLTEHVARFDAAHSALSEALSSIDKV